MIALTHDPIQVQAVRDAVSSDANGGILVFEGVARNHFDGKPVSELWYEAYEPLALAELERIAHAAEATWAGVQVAVVHRLGLVPVGEAAVVIAVGGGHRPEVYEASRHVLEELKARVPIWKQERYRDGSEWKANTP